MMDPSPKVVALLDCRVHINDTHMADSITPPAAAVPPVTTPAPETAKETAPVSTSLLGTDAPAAVTPLAAPATTVPAVAPVAEIKLKVPEKSSMTQAEVDQIATFAKEQGLDQAKAEKLLERENKNIATRQQNDQQAQQTARVNAFKSNEERLKADADFGGAKLSETIDYAKRALAKYADPELIQFLKTHPMGSDPYVIRMLARMGLSAREDGPAGAGATMPAGATNERPDAASRMMASYRPKPA